MFSAIVSGSSRATARLSATPATAGRQLEPAQERRLAPRMSTSSGAPDSVAASRTRRVQRVDLHVRRDAGVVVDRRAATWSRGRRTFEHLDLIGVARHDVEDLGELLGRSGAPRLGGAIDAAVARVDAPQGRVAGSPVMASVALRGPRAQRGRHRAHRLDAPGRPGSRAARTPRRGRRGSTNITVTSWRSHHPELHRRSGGRSRQSIEAHQQRSRRRTRCPRPTPSRARAGGATVAHDHPAGARSSAPAPSGARRRWPVSHRRLRPHRLGRRHAHGRRTARDRPGSRGAGASGSARGDVAQRPDECQHRKLKVRVVEHREHACPSRRPRPMPIDGARERRSASAHFR